VVVPVEQQAGADSQNGDNAMTQKLKLRHVLGLGAAIAALTVTTALVAPQVSQAAPTDEIALDDRGPGVGGPGDTYLADALGVTAAELTAAYQEAQDAAIDQALDEGLITEAQAAQLKNGTGRRGGPDLFRWSGAEIDEQALLADALGISADELADAQQEGSDARLAQAVTDGRITQEQADLQKAKQALHQYIEDNDLYGKAVTAAVADGVLTQAQADAILSAKTGMHGFGGDFGGFMPGRPGGHGGMGDMGGLMPGGPGGPGGATPQQQPAAPNS
jgi:hypothetical protein